ncbi:MAG: 50S ribosomal protein L9 [Gammaproteobacteria bacterium]|nr:MAG: 50S ribosomal protein L9 [Gammaproteobacteria bacterium]
MEVILLQKVNNLGSLGDKVTVKSGYGRNYLIPKKIAKAATEANVAEFEAMRAELESAAAAALALAEGRSAKVHGATVTIPAKAGDEGKLFGSVGTVDIVDALAAMDIEVDKKEIRMPEGAIRATGEYEIQVHLHTDVDATINVVVVPEQ